MHLAWQVAIPDQEPLEQAVVFLLIILVTMVSQFRATRREAASPFQVPARPTLALLAGDPGRNDQWEASIAKLTEDITELTLGQSKLGLRHPVRHPLGGPRAKPV